MKDDQTALLRQLSEDRALASSMLFPHRHRQVTPPFHLRIIDMWRAKDEFVCIEAFREGGKSTISEEFLLLEALFKNFNYTLIFSETYTKAVQRLEAMKRELSVNQKIYTLFGKCGKRECLQWSENSIILPNEVKIEAHGWEEEIRGYKHYDFRPDRAVLDDIENKAMVRDTATVDHNWRRLHMELIPAMDSELGKIRLTGTPLADDCLITRARRSQNWVSAQFPICDGDIDSDDCRPLWPERYSLAWIRRRRDQMSSEGLLSEFNQEYLLQPAGAIGKPFTEDMLTFEDVAPRMYAPKVIILDPARTANQKTSDDSGYVVVSRIGSRIYVHESDGQLLMPDGIVDLAFDGSIRHGDADVAIEKNSLDEWLLQPIRTRILDSGNYLDIQPLTAPHDRNKDQFIMGLQPFLKVGEIVFVGGRQKHKKLVAQILNFPSGKKDVLNALAYAPRVFGGNPVYPDFSDENIAESYIPRREDRLFLVGNSSSTETGLALLSYDGSFLTVLSDWVSSLPPGQCVPDIAKLIRAIHPGKQVSAFVTADQFDQIGRNPLVSALRTVGWKPTRGEHTEMSRASLSGMIRTTMRGRRMFRVDSGAKHTLKALAMGYQWPFKPSGQTAEPKRNASRTLIEAMECLTASINKEDNSPQLQTNATNATGSRYMSALPGRR